MRTSSQVHFFHFGGWSVPTDQPVFPPLSHQGAIPESLGNLVKLEELYLKDNQLSGQFPHFLGWSVPYDQPIFRPILRRHHP